MIISDSHSAVSFMIFEFSMDSLRIVYLCLWYDLIFFLRSLINSANISKTKHSNAQIEGTFYQKHHGFCTASVFPVASF